MMIVSPPPSPGQDFSWRKVFFLGPSIKKVKKTTCLQGVLVPLVSVLGLCGNLLSILVLTSSKIDMKVMRKQKWKKNNLVFPFFDDDDHVDNDDRVINVGEDKEEVEGSIIADIAAVDN